jgi:hypothetical protein
VLEDVQPNEDREEDDDQADGEHFGVQRLKTMSGFSERGR